MESMINLLAHISANYEKVESAVIAVRFKTLPGEPTGETEILTIGDDAIHIFGMSELVKMQLFQQLGEDK
jgi:hypothetical protein